MAKSIKIFKSFEEQELYFLKYFFELSPSERLQALSKIVRQNKEVKSSGFLKKVTIKKHFIYGH